MNLCFIQIFFHKIFCSLFQSTQKPDFIFELSMLQNVLWILFFLFESKTMKMEPVNNKIDRYGVISTSISEGPFFCTGASTPL